jgi:hypothetical protein
MTTQPSESHKHLQNLKPEDIKSLVQQQGKATKGDKEIILRDPPVTDPNLQSIIYDPYLEVKSIGNQTKDGEMYFDLKADSKQLRIKVTCQKIKPEESQQSRKSKTPKKK